MPYSILKKVYDRGMFLEKVPYSILKKVYDDQLLMELQLE